MQRQPILNWRFAIAIRLSNSANIRGGIPPYPIPLMNMRQNISRTFGQFALNISICCFLFCLGSCKIQIVWIAGEEESNLTRILDSD